MHVTGGSEKVRVSLVLSDDKNGKHPPAVLVLPRQSRTSNLSAVFANSMTRPFQPHTFPLCVVAGERKLARRAPCFGALEACPKPVK